MSKRILAFIFSVCIASCTSDEKLDETRSYQMGFQNSAPRFDDLELFLQTLNLWTARADAAIISIEVPWEQLLAGENVIEHVTNNYVGLTQYYRSKNLFLWMYIDPQNGLDRTSDAVDLVSVGKSIAQPAIQQIYQRFVVVMDSLLKPDHVGLALETNLIRSAASPAIYQGVKQAANEAAAELRRRNSRARLSVSLQVDHAWGKLVGGSYQGVEQDFKDFPFIEEVGLSSYPYFGFQNPADIPLDYYARLLVGKELPAFVAEGGWTSKSLTLPAGMVTSSPQLQKSYIEHHHMLLNEIQATAYFQLVFTDIDLKNVPTDVPANLAYFSYLGFVDETLAPKPALDAWDNLFKRSLK
jgi:hypothetical protein